MNAANAGKIDEREPPEASAPSPAPVGAIEPGGSEPTVVPPPPDAIAAGTDVAPELIVEIPRRRQGDEPIKLAVEDKETAERLRQAINGGLRRDELKRRMEAVERQRRELEGIIDSLPRDPVHFYRRKVELDLLEQRLEIDPIGFLVERVKPEIQVGLAKHLLAVPEVFAAVSQEIEDWRDETVRAQRLADLRAKRTRQPARPRASQPLAPRVVKARRVS